MARPIKWDNNIMDALKKRYPHEHNEVLSEEFGISLASLKWYASKHKWRKTREFRVERGRESARIQNEKPVEMVGFEQRIIHSGLLLVRGNTTVHLAK